MGAQLPSHGVFKTEAGLTRFALWAPNANSVAVKFNTGDVVTMTAQDDGWFVAELEHPASSDYNFLIDDNLQVPDPASRAQVNDVHGWSRILDHSQYAWRTSDWLGRPWHEAVIYELHVGLLGGFRGVMDYLPQLAEMGITAIELMPLHEFPGARNWGYDGTLLFAPESSYGTPEELKALIDRAHQLGLMVFIDVVYNHFGPDGNYLHTYAKPFFRDDIQTPWGSAIDFRRREVRDFFYENALMWVLDYHVDGLRFDAVHAIADNQFLVELAQRVRDQIPAERQVHLMLENEANSAYLLEQGYDAQWNDDGHNILHHLLTREHEGYYADFVAEPTQKLARFLGEGFIYQGQETRRGQSRGESSGHLPPTSFILFLQNHDQIGNRAFGERLTQLADEDALKAAVVLLLLSPMIPLLFMGEEWGSQQPFLYFTDHHDELANSVRDGRRNEFAEFTHFADASAREKIPDPNAVTTFTDSRPDHDRATQSGHREWLDFYHALLNIRHREIIPRLAGARAAGINTLADAAVCAFWKMGDGSMLNININIGQQAVNVNTPSTYSRVLFGHRVTEENFQQGLMPPGSAFVCLDDGR